MNKNLLICLVICLVFAQTRPTEQQSPSKSLKNSKEQKSAENRPVYEPFTQDEMREVKNMLEQKSTNEQISVTEEGENKESSQKSDKQQTDLFWYKWGLIIGAIAAAFIVRDHLKKMRALRTMGRPLAQTQPHTAATFSNQEQLFKKMKYHQLQYQLILKALEQQQQPTHQAYGQWQVEPRQYVQQVDSFRNAQREMHEYMIPSVEIETSTDVPVGRPINDTRSLRYPQFE